MLQNYLNATYQCVLADKAIDLKQCPQDRLLVTTNYDLMAAEPGKGTLANESDAVLAAAAKSNSAGRSSSWGLLGLAALAAVALL